MIVELRHGSSHKRRNMRSQPQEGLYALHRASKRVYTRLVVPKRLLHKAEPDDVKPKDGSGVVEKACDGLRRCQHSAGIVGCKSVQRA